MKLKAKLRVGGIRHISEIMNLIKTHEDFNEEMYGIDTTAYNLFFSLITLSSTNDQEKFVKQIEKRMKVVNEYLQGDEVEKGKIFNLVDCMSLVGIGNFYTEKYKDAYESFLLVLEFLKSTKIRSFSKSKLDSP